MFWASRILIRILPSTSKKSKKKPRFLLFRDFYLIRGRIRIRLRIRKSAEPDPDPYQKVTEPKHCLEEYPHFDFGLPDTTEYDYIRIPTYVATGTESFRELAFLKKLTRRATA
jgi:hypothetical protein